MRIRDWSSDVCSSDLEAEEGQEEAGGGESDRQAEDDLDQAPEAAGRLAKCEGQAGDDDDYHRDDLCDRSLHRFQHLLERLFPGHAGSGGLNLCGERQRQTHSDRSQRLSVGRKATMMCRSEEHTSELQSLMR